MQNKAGTDRSLFVLTCKTKELSALHVSFQNTLTGFDCIIAFLVTSVKKINATKVNFSSKRRPAELFSLLCLTYILWKVPRLKYLFIATNIFLHDFSSVIFNALAFEAFKWGGFPPRFMWQLAIVKPDFKFPHFVKKPFLRRHLRLNIAKQKVYRFHGNAPDWVQPSVLHLDIFYLFSNLLFIYQKLTDGNCVTENHHALFNYYIQTLSYYIKLFSRFELLQ